LDLDDRSDPPNLTGTVTGWETRDASGAVVATVSEISWSGSDLFGALINLWDFRSSADIVNLFSSQDVTVDARGAVQDLSELDLSWIDSKLTYLGSSYEDVVIGGRGNDILRGGRDNDTLSGGLGNDRLFGGAGRDILQGDGGNDRLNGGGADDHLFGDAGRDILRGGAGNDTTEGGAGNDRLFGQAGNDNLIGGAGNDTLNGGAGSDEIAGGRGNDVAIGGRGSDRFVFHDGDDSLIIRDFSFGQNDRLELDDALWTGALSTADVVTTFGSVVDGDFVLDFGNGDVIVLEGVTNASQLSEFIDIF
jgi:Ca2+-binding RTX toxin-like protein